MESKCQKNIFTQPISEMTAQLSVCAWETHVTINRVGEKQKMKLVFSDFVDKRRR